MPSTPFHPRTPTCTSFRSIVPYSFGLLPLKNIYTCMRAVASRSDLKITDLGWDPQLDCEGLFHIRRSGIPFKNSRLWSVFSFTMTISDFLAYQDSPIAREFFIVLCLLPFVCVLIVCVWWWSSCTSWFLGFSVAVRNGNLLVRNCVVQKFLMCAVVSLMLFNYYLLANQDSWCLIWIFVVVPCRNLLVRYPYRSRNLYNFGLFTWMLINHTSCSYTFLGFFFRPCLL